jgi:GDP-L-fucose synthase
VPRLIERGARVRTASSTPPRPALSGAEHRIGDLTDRRFADELVDGIEVVFHLAGRRGSVGIQNTRAATMLGENALICLNTIEAARRARVPAFVYTSTVSIYPPLPLYREELAWSANPHPADEYAAWAKRIAEKQIEAIGKQYGVTGFAVVRPVNCFGPFDNFDPETALVVPALIHRALSGEDPLVVWGDGNAVRDFLYVDDAARGLLAAYERGLGQGPINLGSGKGYAIREVVDAVLAATGLRPRVEWDTNRSTGEPRKVADIGRARALLGFEPEIGLQAAIERTVRWYRAERRSA